MDSRVRPSRAGGTNTVRPVLFPTTLETNGMNRTYAFLTLTFLLPFAGCGGGGGGNDAIDATPIDASVSGEGDDESPFAVDVPDGADDVSNTPPDGDADSAQAPSMGDDGPDRQAPVGDGDDTGALIGLWDYTRTSEEGADIALFSIEAGGVVTEYDYRNDASGDGRDCHLVSTASIASRGDDRYDIQSSSSLPGSDSIDDVLITVENGEITFRYLGDAFDPEFGAGQTGITESYPAVTDRNADGLAICEDG